MSTPANKGLRYHSQRWVLPLTALAVLVAACGDDDGDGDGGESGGSPTADAVESGDENAGGDSDDPGQITVDGTTYTFTNVTRCDVGDSFWGPDFRAFTADTGGDYPGIHVGYAPPMADDQGVEDPNDVAFFPSSDPLYYSTEADGLDDHEVTVLDDGAEGSATLGAVGSESDDTVEIEFSFTCSDTGTDIPVDEDAPTTTSSASEEPAPSDQTGTVVFAGATTELNSADGDLDPMAGTGLCEVVDVTGEYGDDYFRIVTDLDDGTPFRLEWDDGLVIGDVFEEEQAEDLDVTKDGRTVSGSATTTDGPIEFSFHC